MRPGHESLSLAAILTVLAFAAGSRPAVAAPSRDAPPAAWWDKGWTMRRALTLAPAGPLAPKTGAATVHTHGAMRADGGDLRVVGPDGKPVGIEVLDAGPGDVATFLFEARDPASRYYAYWGNPQPADPAPGWERDGGLVCDVRKWEHPFPVDSPQAIDLAVKSATEVESRVLRPKIFDGANPGGPSRTYVATYRGFFRVHDEADYDLCTASSDASLLRVEGKEAPLWSRWRGPYAGLRGRFSLRVHLTAGNHPIEYLHFSVGGADPQAAEVGIKRADEERWRVLWDADYVQPVPAEAGPVETRATAPPADFAWATAQHMDAGDGAYLVRVAFEAKGAAAGLACSWDFGDGRKGEGTRVEHSFVGRGTRAVRLTASDGKGAPIVGTQKVAAQPMWGALVPIAPGSEPRWTSDLSAALASGLASEEVEPALRAAQALASDDLLRAVAADAFRRADALVGAVRVDVFLTLAEFFDAAKTRDEAKQASALSLALATKDAPAAADARAHLAAAEHAIQRLGDAKTALLLLDSVRSSDLSDDEGRRAALVRIDAMATAGRLDEARRTLARVADKGPPDKRLAESARRARLTAARSWLVSGDVPAAVDAARGVLDDAPAERLESEVPVFLAEAWLALSDAQSAVVLLERALAIEPDGTWAPKALLLLSKARAALGDPASAERARARLLAEFPYADEAAEVGRSQDAPKKSPPR